MEPAIEISEGGSVITLRVEAARALDDARHHAAELIADAERLAAESEAQARATVTEARLKARLIMASARSQARLMVCATVASVAGVADEAECGEDPVDAPEVGDELGHHPGV